MFARRNSGPGSVPTSVPSSAPAFKVRASTNSGTPGAVAEPLEGRMLLSSTPLHLSAQYSGNIQFGSLQIPTTVDVLKQQGHNVYGLLLQATGARSYFRGYLDNDGNFYFIFNGLNFQGHGFGHATVSLGGTKFAGSEITYQPNGAFPSTLSVTAVSTPT